MTNEEIKQAIIDTITNAGLLTTDAPPWVNDAAEEIIKLAKQIK